MSKSNTLTAKEIREKLNNETLSLFEKARFKEYLETASRFPQYSPNNQMLIWCQDSNATLVCGYSDWQKKYNRHVVKGGHGIKILAPNKKTVWVEKKDSSGNVIIGKDGKPEKEKKSEFKGFSTRTVFDVSVTAGDPIPSITTLLSGRVDGYTELLQILQNISPSPVTFSDSPGGYDPSDDLICIRSGLSQQQTMQDLLPSIASAVLYKQSGTLFDAESLEAESCAFIIAKHFGIESDYAFDYISDFRDGKTLEELTNTIKLIHSVSVGLIKDISNAAKSAASA